MNAPRKSSYQLAALRLEMILFTNDLAEKAHQDIAESMKHVRRCVGQQFRRAQERMEKNHG